MSEVAEQTASRLPSEHGKVQHVVNISDMKIATNPEEVIVTYSLGSCLGVTAYDPVAKIGGMIHCLLPDGANAKEKAKTKPYMFVSIGVPAMVRQLIEKGAKRERLVFKAAGGANMRNDTMFNTGKRNFEALKELFAHNKVTLSASQVGGTIPRTMILHIGTGEVVVRTFGEETSL